MQLRTLNSRGLTAFQDYIIQARAGESPDFKALITQPGFSEPVPNLIDVEALPSRNKRDVGKYLTELLAPLGDPESVLLDRGLWAWLSLFWFDELTKNPRSSSHDVGSAYRYIPEPGNFRNYYRHLLAFPFRIYSKFQSSPEAADVFFTGDIATPGELTEQIASIQDIIANPPLVEAATMLYIDPVTKARKVGAAGAGQGSARRFAAVLNQFMLTFDVAVMKPHELLALLPAEFDKFK